MLAVTTWDYGSLKTTSEVNAGQEAPISLSGSHFDTNLGSMPHIDRAVDGTSAGLPREFSGELFLHRTYQPFPLGLL